jgi:L-alanine-DL-glutamate epimerase-like enolase superfamily enzyme
LSTIESVHVCVARVPLDKVTSFATRTVSSRDYCLVKVRSIDGEEGVGFCYVGSGGGRIAAVAVEELLAPKLVGEDSHRVEGLWQQMYSEALLQGRSGSVMRGISILDTALWDLNARAAGLPLYRYLGCMVTDRVPAYASGGYYLEGKTPDKLAEELLSFVRAGFTAVKMKVGRLSPAEEEARITAAREAIGPTSCSCSTPTTRGRTFRRRCCTWSASSGTTPTGLRSRSLRTRSTCMRGLPGRSKRR